MEDTLDIKTAIDLLEKHNAWRRDNTGKHEMINALLLGRVCDKIIAHYRGILPTQRTATETSTAQRILYNELSESHAKHIADIPFLEDWIIDAMEIYAARKEHIENACRAFPTTADIEEFVKMHTPVLIRPSKKGKHSFISPFSSSRAHRIVIREIAKALKRV